MKRRRIYVVRAFGWQLDYRPDGWLPLGIRDELGVTWSGPRWHVLRLGWFGCITLGRLHGPGEVTVTLTADVSQYVEQQLDRLRAAARDAESSFAFRVRVRAERAIGLAYVDELLEDWRRELGIERGPR